MISALLHTYLPFFTNVVFSPGALRISPLVTPGRCVKHAVFSAYVIRLGMSPVGVSNICEKFSTCFPFILSFHTLISKADPIII
jgi:hypothetical protein